MHCSSPLGLPRKDKKTEPEVAAVEVKAPEVEVQRCSLISKAKWAAWERSTAAIGCLQRSHSFILRHLFELYNSIAIKGSCGSTSWIEGTGPD